MQTIANIKLIKNCQEPNEGECQQCYCRPMWCLTCMGKWFASRQDQQHPETWLSSQVPCPTCRAKFCILDVCIIRWIILGYVLTFWISMCFRMDLVKRSVWFILDFTFYRGANSKALCYSVENRCKSFQFLSTFNGIFGFYSPDVSFWNIFF